eukprot:Phypoly_transcript_06307.p1 GENE.Phypoly_transcript_06307~~Phypoly_transcript_06307.p1  ORF type:complete len:528 (+),score=72.63 Phypoly_transcript_06307:200-1783(+)
MIHLKHNLWLKRYTSTINYKHVLASYNHKRFCSSHDKELKKINVVETEGNIIHATGLLGEAAQGDKEHAGHGNTTIHTQHVIYKNKESKEDSGFNSFFKYASLITFSIIVVVDLLTESRSNKVSSVYIAIRTKKPDVPVFGRDVEITQMRKAFHSPLPSTWFITGPGGCGKSDLVQHVICDHPFSLYLNVRDFIGKEVNAAVVVERFNDVIGLPNKGLFASILAWTGRGSEPIASSQFADSLMILGEALSLVHQPEKMSTLMKYFIRFKSIGIELHPLPDITKPIPCPVVVMDEGQVLSSPMLAASEGAPMLLMAALAAVTSVDNGVAHFVIVSNEATKLRQLLKETSTLNSVWVREMSVADMNENEARAFVMDVLMKKRFGIPAVEVNRKANLIVENFGGRIGDLNTILSIHTMEGTPIEEAIHSLWNIKFHDLAEVLSSVPDNAEVDALKFLRKVMERGTISHKEAVRNVAVNVLHYLVHEGILHRYLVPNTQYPDVEDLPFYIIGSKFTQRILQEKFMATPVVK